MRYANIIAEVLASPWAVMPRKLDAIVDLIDSRAAGVERDPVEAEYAESFAPNYVSGVDTENVVGVVPLVGTMINRAGLLQQTSGAQSPQEFARAVHELADHDPTTHIVLDIDSPGGTVAGTEMAGEAVKYAKAKGKTVIAAISGMGASAAYWVASQADEVYVQESSIVGSIGVAMVHRSTSEKDEAEGVKTTVIRSGENKMLGHPSEPMTDKAMSAMQKEVDALHDVFVKTVVAGRGIDETWLRENVADGSVFIGAEAITFGLADGFGSLQSVVENLTRDKIMPDMATAEQYESALAAEQRESALLERIAELSAMVESQKTLLASYKTAEVTAFVDNEIIGRGKAVASAREQLIDDATHDLEFVKRMYGAVPDGAVAPVASEPVVVADNDRLSSEDSMADAVYSQLSA